MIRPFLLTLEYPPQLGGVAKYLEGEVKASSVPVAVIKVQDLMWRFWPRWLSLLWRVNALSFTKERVGVRLWISHVLPMGYIALVWKLIYKTPYRVYLHGLDLVRPKSSPWKRFWVKIILQNADEIIVNSHATGKLLDYYGIEPSRARVQYPRIEKIDIDKYKPIGEKLRQKYNIENKPILLTISRLVKRKGIDL
ncbi:MAG: glycosyltransferase, partial [Candidatus Komeilibacteria bacterium]|nr:glycosyltransferase [Candidatus Komeilibacteria bacterium]